MEDVIGGHGSPERFARFLNGWQAILARRVEQAAAAISSIEGVRGLILAGGIGRDAPWPLSDIDLIPMYDDRHAPAASVAIEQRRMVLLPDWIAEGWWTGLDIGKLAFRQSEVRAALAVPDDHLAELLADDRWYHALDKGYGSRPLYDPDGLAADLSAWFTAHRFASATVELCLARERRELRNACQLAEASVARGDLLGGKGQVRAAVKWLQTWRLESWGERDNSQGRLGTRFSLHARSHGLGGLVDELDALSDLDERSVTVRLAAAPSWVQERHDRSLRARQHIGEAITPLQDARDTLRVCTLYATRIAPTHPYPEWLAIPTDPNVLSAQSQALNKVMDGVLGDMES